MHTVPRQVPTARCMGLRPPLRRPPFIQGTQCAVPCHILLLLCDLNLPTYIPTYLFASCTCAFLFPSPIDTYLSLPLSFLISPLPSRCQTTFNRSYRTASSSSCAPNCCLPPSPQARPTRNQPPTGSSRCVHSFLYYSIFVPSLLVAKLEIIYLHNTVHTTPVPGDYDRPSPFPRH